MVDNIGKKLNKISTPTPALYEMLAEECTELAKEALSMSRILRRENPTPKIAERVIPNITEEFTDVYLVAKVLKIQVDLDILETKLDRWLYRIDQTSTQK